MIESTLCKQVTKIGMFCDASCMSAESKRRQGKKAHDDGHAIHLLQLFSRLYADELFQVLFQFIPIVRLLCWQQEV